MVLANEIIVVSIRVKIELKLLLELEFGIHRSLALIFLVLEIYILDYKVLGYVDIFQKLFYFLVFFATLGHLRITSYNLERYGSPIISALIAVSQLVLFFQMLSVGTQELISADLNFFFIPIFLKILFFTVLKLGNDRGSLQIFGCHYIQLELHVFSELIVVDSKRGIPSIFLSKCFLGFFRDIGENVKF